MISSERHHQRKYGSTCILHLKLSKDSDIQKGPIRVDFILKVKRSMFVELDIDEMTKIALISMNVLILKEMDATKNGQFALILKVW